MPNSLSFTCKHCGYNKIEEIRIINKAVLIEDITEKYGIQYGNETELLSIISHYRCSRCYHSVDKTPMPLASPIHSPRELISLLSGND